MPSATKKRSQGGGRTPNSEPRQQVFREFGGCNFELSPRDFTMGKDVYQEQTDLQMNYVVVQNNAEITSNKTIETRNNIVKLFSAPENYYFRYYSGNDKIHKSASILVNDKFIIGIQNKNTPSDCQIAYGSLSNLASGLNGRINSVDKTGQGVAHHWSSFAFVNDDLVATTEENTLWTGHWNVSNQGVITSTLENAKPVPTPTTPTIDMLKPVGALKISAEDESEPEEQEGQESEEQQTNSGDKCVYRVAIAFSYINKYGPTACSDQLTFYTNYPITEWHSGCFLRIKGTVPSGFDIKAIELYYSENNSSTLKFAGRTDIIKNNGDWSFDWIGYLDVTSMWPMANLLSPTQNYTEGVKAKYVNCIDGRMYFWGNNSEPYRLWIGGNPGNLYSVSPGTGGGFVDVEPGTHQEIRVVTKYKTQSGNSIVTMLCDSPNSSKEQRYNLVENSITISNEQNMKSWQAEQVAGAVGCKSYKGALVCEDGLYSVSRYGLALTTMTMEYNSQIRANYVSDPIKPVFTEKEGLKLKYSVLLECDGVLYLALGKGDGELNNILFCYDIDAKAWWTISLDINEPIFDLIHIDYEGTQEGIGIITDRSVYLLPTTHNEGPDDEASFPTTIQTAEISTAQPQQNWFYLSQLEFHFDYFFGELLVELDGIDQFGRKVHTEKHLVHDDDKIYDIIDYMRIDLRLRSYQIRITGIAKFRLTHFIAKLYTMSAKQGLVWGFDDSQSFRKDGAIHPTFKDYNDIERAIIP